VAGPQLLIGWDHSAGLISLSALSLPTLATNQHLAATLLLATNLPYGSQSFPFGGRVSSGFVQRHVG
jgi:hypothetical protein